MADIGNLPEIVSADEWLAARKALLAQEKDVTRARDRLNAERRRLPMVRVEKEYVFDGADGSVTLADLFDGRPTSWCTTSCSRPAGTTRARAARRQPIRSATCDSCMCATRASSRSHGRRSRRSTPIATAWGGTFPWISSFGGDFNWDFHATLDDRVAPVQLHFRDETELAHAGTPWTGGPWTEAMRGEEVPGISVFLRVDDEIFHTYSTFGRGIEEFHNGYPWLDLTPLGRQEAWEEPARARAAAGTAGRRSRDALAGRVRRLTTPDSAGCSLGSARAFARIALRGDPRLDRRPPVLEHAEPGVEDAELVVVLVHEQLHLQDETRVDADLGRRAAESPSSSAIASASASSCRSHILAA